MLSPQYWYSSNSILDEVNIEREYYTTLGCITDNNSRIQNAKRHSSDSAKPRRCYLRGQKTTAVTKQSEGKIYSAGNF